MNKFTGVPSINIPIHTLKEGPLSHNISLSYHASGMRVSEASSWVGMGWSLNAGGMIARTVLGMPDESYPYGYLNTNNFGTLEGIANGAFDAEPDLFMFNAGGYSGKFIINKDLGDIIQYPASDIKIVPLDVTLNEFLIITPNGDKYYYGSSDLDSQYHGTIIVDRLPVFQATSSTSVSTKKSSASQQKIEWYLRRIESHDGEFHIDFTYREERYSLVSPASERRVKAHGVVFSYTDDFPDSGQWWNSGTPFGYTIGLGFSNESLGQITIRQESGNTAAKYANIQKFKTGKLKKITTSLEEVNFQEELAHRQDLDSFLYTDSRISQAGGTHALDYIEIKPRLNSKYCKKVDFNFYYLDSKASPSFTYEKRLALRSIQEISCSGGVSVLPYSFEYDFGNGTLDNPAYLPSRFDKAIDAWGFYNGATSNNSLRFNIPPTRLAIVELEGVSGVDQVFGSANRNSHAEAMKLGSLEAINFPEGGRTEFDLEANTILDSIQSRVPTSPYGINPVNRLETCNFDLADYDECCISPGEDFAMVNEIQSSVTSFITRKMFENGVFKIYIKDAGCPDDIVPAYVNGKVTLYVKRAGRQAARTTELQRQFPRPFVAGFHYQKEVSVRLNDIFDNDPSSPYYFREGSYELTVSGVTAAGKVEYLEYGTTRYNRIVGGLRIKELRVLDQNNNLANKKNFTYAEDDGVSSSGVLYGRGEPKFGFLAGTVTADGGLNQFNYVTQVWQSDPAYPLSDVQGHYIGYGSVKETQDNGSTSLYKHQTEVADVYGGDYPFIPFNYKFGNGNLLTQVGKNRSGVTVDLMINTYQTYLVGVNPLLSRRVISIPCGSDCGGVYLMSEFVRQKSAISRNLSVSKTIDGVTTISNNGYGPEEITLNPQSTTIVNSDGRVYKTEYKFALDFFNEGKGDIYDVLHNTYNIRSPMETISKVNNIHVGGSRSEYAYFSGKPYPKYLKKYEITWNEQGGLVSQSNNENNYRTLVTYNSYSGGVPTAINRDGWIPTENYTWLSGGRLESKVFKDFTWNYNYFPNTSLISNITDIDGQTVSYDYDPLMRLATSSGRNGNVVTSYDYKYPGQSTTHPEAHVKSQIIITPTAGSSLSNRTSYTYIDGLGRTIQQVQQQHTDDETNPKDVFSAVLYDQYGRQKIAYEPVASSASDGRINTSLPPLSIPSTLTSTRYEDSPLNRVLGVTPPGWHETKTEYGRNEDAISSGGVTYPIGSLSRTSVLDPTKADGSWRNTEFKDKLGRVVLTRMENGVSARNKDTQYLYDDKNRVVAVLPPGATFSTPGLIYQYVYDERDRIVEKKIPDQDWVFMKYDDRNLLTYTQDGNMRATGRWMHSHYDDYGRMVESGFVNSDPADGNEVKLFDLSLTRNCYDGCAFVETVPPIYLGKLKRSETRVLGTDDWLRQTFFYDNYGRLDRESGATTVELLGGTNDFRYYETEFRYDFADNLLKSKTTYTSDTKNDEYIIEYNYEIDHAGRQIAHKVSSPQFAPTPITLSKTNYTVKDQIAMKGVGYGVNNLNPLQACNYTYLPNGFLSRMNDVTNLGTDLFALKLKYDVDQLSGATPQRNGNISEAIWKTAGETNTNVYGYEYDFLQRLKSAISGIISDDSFTANTKYNTSYSYDGRGNMMSLTRNGVVNTGAMLAEGAIDNLTYSYAPGTNRLIQVKDLVTGFSPSEDLTITEPVTESNDFEASNNIYGRNQVSGGGTVNYRAGNSVLLQDGFHVTAQGGGTFRAFLDPNAGQDNIQGGFVERSTVPYEYDDNGNLTKDLDKNITLIEYNYLNLPQVIQIGNDVKMLYTYSADGQKHRTERQTLGDNGVWTTTYIHYYLPGLEIRNDEIEALNHADGRIVKKAGEPLNNPASYTFQYKIADHLGNTRVLFADKDGDRTLGTSDILQQNHYYPFGLEQTGSWNTTAGGADMRYRYNGKEFSEELGLYDYGARWYDPAIGRWGQVDPHASSYSSMSPYSYVYNNPLLYVDPDGRDNILYLLFLPGAGKEINRNQLVSDINDIFKTLGINVQAKIFDHGSVKDFDPAFLDPTDNYALVGTDALQSGMAIEEKDGERGPDWKEYVWASSGTIEISQGQAIGLNEEKTKRDKQSLLGESSTTRAAAFLGVHSYGHGVGGIVHPYLGSGDRDRGFMKPGNSLRSDYNSINEILADPENSIPVNAIRARTWDHNQPIGPLPGGGCLPSSCPRSPTDNYLYNMRSKTKQ